MKAELIRDFAMQPDAQEITLFLAAGITATAVQYCVFIALIEIMRVDPASAAILAFVCGATTSHLLNFRFPFKSSTTTFLEGFLQFPVFAEICLGLNTLSIIIAARFDSQCVLAQASAIGVVLVSSYLGARLFVSRR